jgi:hypothetical protein
MSGCRIPDSGRIFRQRTAQLLDGTMPRSGMEAGLNQSYEALDRLLAKLG